LNQEQRYSFNATSEAVYICACASPLMRRISLSEFFVASAISSSMFCGFFGLSFNSSAMATLIPPLAILPNHYPLRLSKATHRYLCSGYFFQASGKSITLVKLFALSNNVSVHIFSSRKKRIVPDI